MSIIETRAAAAELDRLRSEAVDRGVEVVSVFDIAERVEVLRAHERAKAAEAEELLRQVAEIDARRNHGIGQEQ